MRKSSFHTYCLFNMKLYYRRHEKNDKELVREKSYNMQQRSLSGCKRCMLYHVCLVTWKYKLWFFDGGLIENLLAVCPCFQHLCYTN